MAHYYCTRDYDALSESFLKRFTKEGSTYTVDIAIKDELDVFVKGYKQEKKRYDWWMSHPRIESPKNNKEAWYNRFWDWEHSEESVYAGNMKTQKAQFDAMEKAIMRWLPMSSMTDKEKAKVIKKIETRKAKFA